MVSMKNLILMTNVNNTSNENMLGTHSSCQTLYKYAVKKSMEWSKRIGCEFKCITDTSAFPDYSPTWQRMVMFSDQYKDYDNIVYVDADLVISKNAPDIFEIMNQYEQEFFACSDYPLPVRIKTGYFNAGFTGIKKSLINKCSMNYINKKMEKYKNKEHFDQCALNEIVKEKCNSYVQLSKSWNIFPPRDIDNYDPFYGVHYIHYYKDAWKYKDQAKERLNLIEKCEGKITFHQTTLNKIKYFPEYWKNTEKGILEFKT